MAPNWDITKFPTINAAICVRTKLFKYLSHISTRTFFSAKIKLTVKLISSNSLIQTLPTCNGKDLNYISFVCYTAKTSLICLFYIHKDSEIVTRSSTLLWCLLCRSRISWLLLRYTSIRNVDSYKRAISYNRSQ